jgi:hypothetical protein
MAQLRVVVGFLASGVLLLSALSASAQVSSYRPPTPTLSPWLNLYGNTPGPLDSYHSYVLPQLQLRDAMRQQDARIQNLGHEVTRLGESGEVPPTGTGSVYMSYLHYYPALGTPTSAPFSPSIYPSSPPRRDAGFRSLVPASASPTFARPAGAF